MISLCITTYNRTDLLYESFRQVLNDDRISEIVIVDDHSEESIWQTIFWQYNGVPKVKLYRNEKNLDCYRNKREAVSKASNEWVIVWDSDNVMTKEYIDKIYEQKEGPYTWSEDTIYNPSFAKPHFDFRRFQLETYDMGTVQFYIQYPEFQTMLNAMNYFVNRDEYLRVWDGSVDPVTSDSIYQNYNWLKAGNSIYVVPGLEYEHRVHSGSHYQNNVRRTPRGFHEEIVNKLKELR
jgi:glycosyltransferase involved in cell wall biosynthesis